jgi:hypothetical protein
MSIKKEKIRFKKHTGGLCRFYANTTPFYKRDFEHPWMWVPLCRVGDKG